MPRARRAWSTIRDEIRLLLRETDSASSFWTDALLLNLANTAIDLRVMELADADEGWVTDQYTAALVADQREYPLPEGAGRIKQVSLKWTEGAVTYERDLDRDDQWGTTIVHSAGNGAAISTYRPTYQLQGNLLLLEPMPRFSLAGALQIDLESAPTRLAADGDKLDLRFPDVMETLLVYDTALLALAVEHTQGNLPESYVNHLLRWQTKLEAAFAEYITDRTQGRVFGRPYRQGD